MAVEKKQSFGTKLIADTVAATVASFFVAPLVVAVDQVFFEVFAPTEI